MKFSTFEITYFDRQVSVSALTTRVLAHSGSHAEKILRDDLGFIDIVEVKKVDI